MSAETGSHDGLHLGFEEVDREHALQMSLLDALEKTSDAAQAADIVQTFRDATEAHFIGEEMLMRQHSYPLYHAHVEEHGRLLTALAALREKHQSGEAGATHSAHAPKPPQKQFLDELRDWLRAHVRGMDRDFASFAASGASAAGSTRA